MKELIPAVTLEDGTVVPAHEVEVVCSHCKDPVSEEEKNTGVCTSCGQPWAASQSVNIFATTFPAVDASVFKFI